MVSLVGIKTWEWAFWTFISGLIRKVQQTLVWCTAAKMKKVYGVVLTAVLLAFQISSQVCLLKNPLVWYFVSQFGQ